MNEISVKKFFPLEPDRLFRYFTDKNLVEKWQAPTGMTLKLPKFEAKEGGAYRYEHTGKDGLYVCEGVFKEFVPGKRIVQHDSFIRGPEGNNLFENLECVIDFESVAGGTEVQVKQTGFTANNDLDMCQGGWDQSFDTLTALVSKETGVLSSKTKPEINRELWG